jgi:serine O-acetyltransferase
MCKVYALYKCGRTLYLWKVPILPKLIYYFTRFFFTSSVPYTATIGPNTSFNNYGMGVVIHRRVVIGHNCEISQHVTIGGRGGFYEVPVIGNDVFIGDGAKILGPIKVGDGAIIGANAVVLHDVPAHSVAVGIPARVVKENVQAIVGPEPRAVVAM